MKQRPKVSVCIPVYGTEPILAECLESAIKQDLDCFEIIVCNDCSPSLDENGWNCKKIVRKCAAKAPRSLRKNIIYIEHLKNKGIFETRRDLLYTARGEYISYFDSDDVMAEGALRAMYEAAKGENAPEGGFDIVHGKSQSFYAKNGKMEFVDFKPTQIYNGTLLGRDIFDGALLESNHSLYLWAKCIKRDIYISAFELIPKVFCNYGEDFLIYFYTSFMSKSYIGVDKLVYYYRINTGLSSNKKVTSEAQWKLIVSVSSLFSVLYTWIDEQNVDKENPVITEEEILAVKKRAVFFIRNNLQQMRTACSPEFMPRAREILCEFWGKSFVERIEKMEAEEEEKKRKANFSEELQK